MRFLISLSLFEASAVGVPSLHRFRLQCNCNVLSLPLFMFVVAVFDDVAFAVLSNVLSPLRFLVVVVFFARDEF